MFGELLAGLVGGVAEVFETAAPVLLSGVVMKHGIRKLPNNTIPYLNGILGTGLALLSGADPGTAVQTGIMTSVTGTGTHQLLKVGMKKVVGGRLTTLAKKIGPGDQLSL